VREKKKEVEKKRRRSDEERWRIPVREDTYRVCER
jgi:hypothetical protein